MDFEFEVYDDYAIVVKYNGNSTKVVIPEEYNGVPVISISGYCFYGSNIKSIVGRSITSIDYSVFWNCKNLTEVNLPVCISIGNGAFMSCRSLTDISFPVCTTICTGAFESCSGLTSVNFPVCKNIGEWAFEGCNSLEEISLPVCENICSRAFNCCSSLREVNLPVCKHIGELAFNFCTNLTTVSLPVCEYIGEFAFRDCIKLVKRGKYKATNIDLTCRDFQYEIGKWFEEDDAILCQKGFHYVENFYDIFNYYWGRLGADLRIFEIDSYEIADELRKDSKRVCKKIKLVREIKSYKDFF